MEKSFKQYNAGVWDFFLVHQRFLSGAPRGAYFQQVKAVCSASCQQLASESLVGVISSELRSKHPVLLGVRLC